MITVGWLKQNVCYLEDERIDWQELAERINTEQNKDTERLDLLEKIMPVFYGKPLREGIDYRMEIEDEINKTDR
jgi:hypothetical protein